MIVLKRLHLFNSEYSECNILLNTCKNQNFFIKLKK